MIRNKMVWRHYRVIGAVYAALFLALLLFVSHVANLRSGFAHRERFLSQ